MTQLSIALLLLGWCPQDSARAQGAAAPPRVEAELAGPTITMFSWTRDRCEPEDTPDSQARAFRDASGAMHLFSVSDHAFAFVGPDLAHLRRDCHPAFHSMRSKDPSQHSNYSWLASFFTNDGRTVQALVHNEFHGWEQPALCPSRDSRKCSYVTFLSARSQDGGRTFATQSPPGGVVVSTPYVYEPDMGFAGYMNPSNILQAGSYFYVAFGAMPYKAEVGGICMIRTQTPFDSASWRAWDGHDFTVSFIDPYIEQRADPAKHVCAPLNGALKGFQAVSLARHEPDGLFIMVGLKDAGARHGRAGFLAPYVSTSFNLMDWSPAVPLLSPEDEERLGSAWYPTLIDPVSSDRNFSTIGDSPELIYVHFNDHNDSRNRDLLRVPVRLRLTPPS